MELEICWPKQKIKEACAVISFYKSLLNLDEVLIRINKLDFNSKKFDIAVSGLPIQLGHTSICSKRFNDFCFKLRRQYGQQ